MLLQTDGRGLAHGGRVLCYLLHSTLGLWMASVVPSRPPACGGARGGWCVPLRLRANRNLPRLFSVEKTLKGPA